MRISLLVIFSFIFLKSFSQVPIINSFNPTSGAVGTNVTINGENFSTNPTNDLVYFGGISANVLSATNNQLSVIVPAGISFDPITVTVDSLTAYSNMPFIITFQSNIIQFDSSSFESKKDFDAEYLPTDIRAADIDGDSKPDMIVVNGGQNTISIYRNVTSGGQISFEDRIDLPAANGPTNVFTGDLDGDGKLDIVVTNFNIIPSTVSIYKNTSTIGNISFTSKKDFLTGDQPLGVFIADIDGDGKPDIITANIFSNNVSVLKNTTTDDSISFATKVDFSVGASPYNVFVEDLNGDKKPDIVTANIGSNNISVLLNASSLSTVSFIDRTEYAAGNGPAGISIADLDGDGKPDVVSANIYSNDISILKNTSTNGSISFANKINLSSGTQPTWVTIGDLDGDGKPDIGTANSQSASSVSIFKNVSAIGSISFDSKVDYATGKNPQALFIDDLDGDGKPDIEVANGAGLSFSVLKNNINSTLALKWLNFSADEILDNVYLKWQTIDEENIAFFYLEKSTDGKKFYSISKTQALDKLSNTYSYVDSNSNFGNTYYRLKIVNKDNSFFYSKVLLINKNNITLSVYPNPAKDKLHIIYKGNSTSAITINIYNLSGRKVISKIENAFEGVNNYILNTSNIISGVYILEVKKGNELLQHRTKVFFNK